MRSLFKDAVPISVMQRTASEARLGRDHHQFLRIPPKTSKIPPIRKHEASLVRRCECYYIRKLESYKCEHYLFRKHESYKCKPYLIRKLESYHIRKTEPCLIRKHDYLPIRRIPENNSPQYFQKDPKVNGRGWVHRNSLKALNENEEILVKVNLGLTNAVNVHVRQAPRQEADNPIIIFLSRGIPKLRQNESWRGSLALGANAIIVEIHFPALSKYPLPIHTVLAGFDWARTNLTASGTIFNPTRVITNKPPKIGVCGELVGGGLATMLALREGIGKSAEPELPGISALAVGNPILDWTSLTPTDRVVVLALSANGLLKTRKAYFSRPETYFDPFASPLLFFRTPSSEIPNHARASNEHGPLKSDPEDDNPLSEPEEKRRSARKFPPAGSDLILPWTKVEVGKDWVLKGQGADLVELMRKSHKRSEAERTAEATDPVKREFEVVEREGLGLWDGKHAFEIGQWFGKVLREP